LRRINLDPVPRVGVWVTFFSKACKEGSSKVPKAGVRVGVKVGVRVEVKVGVKVSVGVRVEDY
jgi:hypothetical protein